LFVFKHFLELGGSITTRLETLRVEFVSVDPLSKHLHFLLSIFIVKFSEDMSCNVKLVSSADKIG